MTVLTATCLSDDVTVPVVLAPEGTPCACGAVALYVEVAGTAHHPAAYGSCQGCLDEYDWVITPA